jgi:preprotein translocase subunit SecB
VSKVRGLPQSGYKIEKIYCADLRLTRKVKPDDEEEGGAISFGWNWRLLERNLFEVRLLVGVDPTKQREEFVRVNVIGRFRQTSETPTVKLTDFVLLQGPAILFPFARQSIATLTASGYHGAYYLPSVDVTALMADFDPESATGAKQLKGASERPIGSGPETTKVPVGREKSEKKRLTGTQRPKPKSMKHN